MSNDEIKVILKSVERCQRMLDNTLANCFLELYDDFTGLALTEPDAIVRLASAVDEIKYAVYELPCTIEEIRSDLEASDG